MARFARSPDPIDVAIGARVAALRQRAGISRKKLAEALGITYQQTQKYEGGDNRIPASRLRRIASALDTTVSILVDQDAHTVASMLLPVPGSPRLLEAFSQIESLKERSALVALARALAARPSD